MIGTFTVALIQAFKADPKRALHIVMAAIGYMTVAVEVLTSARDMLAQVAKALTGIQ